MFPKNRSLVLAGYDTTGSSLVWTTLALARHPEVQVKLRREVRQKAREIHERGDIEFSAVDLEAMPYLEAVIKVRQRLCPLERADLTLNAGVSTIPPRFV